VVAREPKPSAWPGVVKASEGHFPNRAPDQRMCVDVRSSAFMNFVYIYFALIFEK
jgi:hypothetical protein